MKSTRIFVCSVVLFACSLHGSKLFAGNIESDPLVLKGLDRQNWEPGGNYFTGTPAPVESGTRTGQIFVNPTSFVRLGNFMIEGAIISGRYGYTVNPHMEHSVDEATISYKDSQTVQGAQTSLALQWDGTIVRRAYDVDLPQPARTEYSFLINGNATGTYLLSGAQLQALDIPKFGARVGDNVTGSNDKSRSGAGTPDGGVADLLVGHGDAERVRRAADVANGFVIQQGWIEAGYKNFSVFKAQNTEWKYAGLENFENGKNFVTDHPTSF